MALDLHGAEVVEVQRPPGPIAVGASSVIGLVGSAPDASTAAAASLTLTGGAGVGIGAVTVTANTPGTGGNAITIALADPGGPQQNASISVTGNAISVNLAFTSTGGGSLTTTAAQLVTALNGDTNASPLITAALTSAADGTEVMKTAAAAHLADGRADVLLNVPQLVATAADVAALGDRGSLPAALRDVFLAAGDLGATVVYVRTADDLPASLAGVLTARSGCYGLLDAEARTGSTPRLIAAPGAADQTITTALAAVAADLRAVAVVSVDATTPSAAAAASPDTENVFAVWPQLVTANAAGQTVERPADALICGHIARIDREESFAASPSNRLLRGVLRTAKPVDWRLDDRSSGANLLNRANVATAIRRGASVYLWGNALSNGELLAGRRARSIIGDELTDFVRDYVDRRVDVPFVEHVLGRMNGYLRSQVLAGNIASGRAWFDDQYNTADTLAANRVTFSFELGLHAIAEQITFRQSTLPVGNDIIRQLTAGS